MRKMRNPMDGVRFIQAMKYALMAAPRSTETNDMLAHLVFHSGRVIGGDGQRWHIGYLPGIGPEEACQPFDFPPFAATRASCHALVGLLAAMERATPDEGIFHVDLEGPVAHVRYGLDNEMEREFEGAVVGRIPSVWEPPVSEHAVKSGEPMLPVASHLISQATRWPFAIAEWSSENRLLRVDLRQGELRRATAILVPIGNRATLPEEKQRELFRATPEIDPGLSCLALKIDEITEASERVQDAIEDMQKDAGITSVSVTVGNHKAVLFDKSKPGSATSRTIGGASVAAMGAKLKRREPPPKPKKKPSKKKATRRP